MNRGKDALNLLSKLVNEKEEYRRNANLFVLRARVNIKENNVKNSI
jgi:hypothetical protein